MGERRSAASSDSKKEPIVRWLDGHTPSTHLELEPVLWNLVTPSSTLSLIIDPGTTGLVGVDGLVSLLDFPDAHTWSRVPNGESVVIRLPDNTRMRTATPVTSPTSPPLTLLPVTLQFGESSHGVISKGGLVRLQQQFGMEVDWATNTITFPLRTAQVRRVAVQQETESDEIASAREKLFEEFADVFADELQHIPPARSTDIRLPRPTPASLRSLPRSAMFRSMNPSLAETEFLTKYFEPLIKVGLVEPSTSEFNSPVFCVPKEPLSPDPMRRYRPVFDQRPVNTLFPRLPTEYEHIPNTLQKLASASFVSAFDLLAGFHQVRVHPDDRKYLAFTHPDRSRWQWTVWPFGFTASPFALQQMVRPLVAGHKEMAEYVDDLAVATTGTLDDHIRDLRSFLLRCRAHQVLLSKPKAQIAREKIEFLGHVVTVGGGIQVHPDTAQKVLKLEVPRDRKTLEQVLGLFNWVMPSVDHFSERVAPLRAALHMAKKLDKHHKRGGRRPSSILFPLTGEALMAFEDIRSEMQQPTLLAPFRPDVLPVVVSDASQLGVAAALYQEGKLVSVWSSTVAEARSRWKVFDLEAFALLRSLQHWRHWLVGRKVLAVTDHAALVSLSNPNTPFSPKIGRWLADLLEFDLEIVHVGGTTEQMALSDYLSRNPQCTVAKGMATLALQPGRERIPFCKEVKVYVRRLEADVFVPPLLEHLYSQTVKKRSTQAVATHLRRRHDVTSKRWVAKDLPPLTRRKEWLSILDDELKESPVAGTVRLMHLSTPSAALLEKIRNVEDPLVTDARSVAPDLFHTEDGLLWRKESSAFQLVIPDTADVRDSLFELAHRSHLAGHRDAERTLFRLRSLCWWPKMDSWVSERVSQCVECCRAKHRTTLPRGLPQTVDIPTFPFEHIHLDAMSMPEDEGFDQVWVVVDRLTHFACFLPAVATDSSARLARRLFDSVFAVFGIPALMTSDNDSRLTSEFFTALMSMAGVSRFVTPPHRKQGNGLSERFIRSLRAFLRTLGSTEWVAHISAAQFAFNTGYSAAVGSSPAQLLLGYQPRGPLEVVLPSSPANPEAGDFLRRRAVAQETGRSRLFEQQLDRVQRASLRRLPPEDWEVGDLAFVSASRLSNPNEAHLPAKLQSAFHGPFPVVEVCSPNIVVRLPSPHQERDFTVNFDDAFQFAGTESDVPSEEGVVVEPDADDDTKDDDRPLYSARRLISHRRFGRILKYKVDWEAASPSFEKEADISDDLLREYWQKIALRSRAVIPAEARKWLQDGDPEATRNT